MAPKRPQVGVIFTLLDLYRNVFPDMPERFGAMWRGIVDDVLGEHADLHVPPVSHTPHEVAAAVASCEAVECDLLLVLPMAYAASGSARNALIKTAIPIVLVSTARDATLPHDMGGDEIRANHAVHGIQDLANVLSRAGRPFDLVVGAHQDEAFRGRLKEAVLAGAAARVLKRGKVGRVGKPFEGMLDFGYDPKQLADKLGLTVEEETPERLGAFAREVTEAEAAEYAQWARDTFDVAVDVTEEELLASARWSLALQNIVRERNLDAITMNFLSVAAGGAETMPFLGASRLMSRGIGYAGEGDVLGAALTAAVAALAGEATFTEMFCPDYARDQVLLSHMGECNFALADPAKLVALIAKPFAFGDCMRPAVPVFQLRPGTVTVASITEWPGEGFRIVAVAGEVIPAPDHVNLDSPYTRITFGKCLPTVLERYSHLGGTHHLALGYGDLRGGLQRIARQCGIGFETV